MKGVSMNKISSFILIASLVAVLMLPGCTKTEYVTVTNTDTTTITSEKTKTVMFDGSLLEENGTVRIQGRGAFYYMQISNDFRENIVFHGVTFVPLPSPGTTVTAPIAYWVRAQFADETSEELIDVGFRSDYKVNIALTNHDNPTAGVMMLYDSIGEAFLYLLVSME